MKKYKKWYLSLLMLFVYFIFFLFYPAVFWSSFSFFTKTLLKIIPIFAFVFVLMIFVNHYISNDLIIKHLRGSKLKSWFYIIVGGIISTGPEYMWYPLLNDLRNKGVSNGEIASFLYNRSIKPALLPIIILYFGLKYTLVLFVVTILLSFVQAFIVELLVSYNITKKNEHFLSS